MAILAHVMFICILYIGSVRAHFSEFSSGLSFLSSPRLFWESLKYTFRLWFWDSSHSSCTFFRLFRFAVFLHSSCSVAASYFMLIPVFVILLFQLPCSIFVSS